MCEETHTWLNERKIPESRAHTFMRHFSGLYRTTALLLPTRILFLRTPYETTYPTITRPLSVELELPNNPYDACSRKQKKTCTSLRIHVPNSVLVSKILERYSLMAGSDYKAPRPTSPALKEKPAPGQSSSGRVVWGGPGQSRSLGL